MGTLRADGGVERGIRAADGGAGRSTMKLGVSAMRWSVNFGLWGNGMAPNVDVVRHAEALGYDSVWTAEAYGTDAVVPVTWLAACTTRIRVGTAVLQMAGRTPATTAMTAATLDAYSDGRFILGLGASGPQVVEGWHNAPFDHPVERTREYVEVVRRLLDRHVPVRYSGNFYRLPYEGADATGEGKALRLAVRRRRKPVPLFLAAMGPRNVRLAFELFDGWLPFMFSPRTPDALGITDLLANARDGFEVAPLVPIVVDDDIERCRRLIRPVVAFWIGAMGSRTTNFYAEMFARVGFEGAVRGIQESYGAGRTADAAAKVPDELLDEVALLGPRGRVAEQFERWKTAPVTTMILGGATKEAITLMAELAL